MITETDKKILDFITEYYKKTRFYPSYDEIAKGIDRYSKATIYHHMKRLEKEGIIIRKSNSSHAYRLANIDFLLGRHK